MNCAVVTQLHLFIRKHTRQCTRQLVHLVNPVLKGQLIVVVPQYFNTIFLFLAKLKPKSKD